MGNACVRRPRNDNKDKAVFPITTDAKKKDQSSNGKNSKYLETNSKVSIGETKDDKGLLQKPNLRNMTSVASQESSKSVTKQNYLEFLRTSWPGSILKWTEEDIVYFASCFTPHHINSGEEISTNDHKSFFIVAEGSVEVHAILPTIRKKTGHIREFLCKKSKGDMVYIPSLKELISESNLNELYVRENHEQMEHADHKNLLNLIDTITILCTSDSTILQLDWSLYDTFVQKIRNEEINDETMQSQSKLDLNMLQTIMETNLTDYLVNIPIMESIPYSKLEILSSLCHYCIEKEGAIICREGDIGDEVYIILQGEVKVEVKASTRMVELFTEGVLSLPKENTEVSSSNVEHSSTSSSGHLVESGYKRKGSVQFKCDYDAPKKNGRARLSKAQRNYSKRRQTLFQAGHHYRNEQTVARKNDQEVQQSLSLPIPPETNSMNKRQSVFHLDESDQYIELGRFGQGDYFGEMATFIELPRAATVTATKNVLMASLSKSAFRNLYHVFSPDLETEIEKVVKTHMLQTLLLSKSPFLEVIGTVHAERMADLTCIEKVEKNKIIFEEGDEADKFYFVYSGKLSIEKANSDASGMNEIGLLLPGDYFGEMALLNNVKRLATIKSLENTTLLKITRENFYECFQEIPEVISEFVVRMKGKNAELKCLLDYPRSKAVFAKYLEQIHQRIYLDSFDKILEFNRNVKEGTLSFETLKDVAQSICEKYLSGIEWKDFDVFDVKRNVDSFTDLKEMESGCFANVEKELVKEMETEMLPNFKKDALFLAFLTQIRSYDDIDAALLA